MNKRILADNELCVAVAKCCEMEDFASFIEDEYKGERHIFSESLRLRILAIADSLDRPRSIPLKVKLMIVLAALIALLVAAAIGVSGVHDAEYGMDIKDYKDHIEVHYALEGTNSDAIPAPEHIELVYDIQAPKGFEMTSRTTWMLINTMIFESFEINEYGKRDTVTFNQYTMATSFCMDADDVELFNKTVNGVDYYCHTGDGWTQIDWVQYGYIFMISSSELSVDQLISLAEGIYVNEELTEIVTSADMLLYRENEQGRTLENLETDEITVLP